MNAAASGTSAEATAKTRPSAPEMSNCGEAAPQFNPLAVLLHELNQPLTGLQCSLELATVGSHTPEQYVDTIRQGLDLVSRMRMLVEAVREVADIEQGHLSTASCIMANMSMKLGRSLRWDAATHQIVGDEEANKLLNRPYRAPWVHPVA